MSDWMPEPQVLEAKQLPPPTAAEETFAGETDAESSEVQDLFRLFSSRLSSRSMGRGSVVPVSALAKFSSEVDNHNKALQLRREMEVAERARIDSGQKNYEEAQRRKTGSAARAERMQNTRGAMTQVIERNMETAQAARSRKAALRALRQKQDSEHRESGRRKVERMRGNDARLDALEEAVDEAEREEGTKARLARKLALETARTTAMAEKKERAEALRTETQRAVAQRMSDVASSKRQMVQEAQDEIEEWKAMGRREEQRRLVRSASSRERALESHANAARAKGEMMRQRQIEAQTTSRAARLQTAQSVYEREAWERENQARVQQQFASRHLTAEAASLAVDSMASKVYFESPRSYLDVADVPDHKSMATPYRYSSNLGCGERVAAANAALYRRIKQVRARVDDDLMDEAAGAARARVAEESKARKEADAKELAAKNDVYHNMIANAVAKTDDGDGLSTAVETVKVAAKPKAKHPSTEISSRQGGATAEGQESAPSTRVGIKGWGKIKAAALNAAPAPEKPEREAALSKVVKAAKVVAKEDAVPGENFGPNAPHVDVQKAANDCMALKLSTVAELEAEAQALEKQVLDLRMEKPTTRSIDAQIGETILVNKVKINDLMREWDPNGDGTVSKIEFRKAVRKLLKLKDSKEVGKDVDALFTKLDVDDGGTLDIREIKLAFNNFKEVASKGEDPSADTSAQASELKQKAAQYSPVVATTRESEQALSKLLQTRQESTAVLVGRVITEKNIKIGDVIKGWSKDNDDELSKDEFRKGINDLFKSARVESTDEDIDGLFEHLDRDGGGTLDATEIRHALKQLQAQAVEFRNNVRVENRRFIAAVKTTRVAQNALRREQKAQKASEAEQAAKNVA